jgi:ribonuclease HII
MIKRKKKPKRRGRKLKLTKRLRIPKLNHEIYLINNGYKYIAGVDEVGRGAWAGPVVASAVILPKFHRFYQIRDSKLIDRSMREKLARRIKKESLWAIGKASSSEIEKIGLHKATLLAFKRALFSLSRRPDFVLVDAYRIPEIEIEHRPIKKGDMVCASIAAASIVAKVHRDSLMRRLHLRYRRYFFNKHKGYGTRLHQERLAKYGPCEIHRKSFEPIKALLNSSETMVAQ